MGVSVDSLVGTVRPAAAPLRFTPMCGEDLDAVMEIERRSFPEPWTPGLFLHELKVPFSKTVLARRGDEIVGYICRWLVGDEVHILNIAVRPEARAGGIGRALVALVMEEAAQAGAAVVTLEVRRENEAAIALYQSFGFTERGVRRNYYARGHDAVVMSCDLRVNSEPTSACVAPVETGRRC
jgi:[ribosomal protein S18]-alanine N-acetyltransferase